MGTLYIVATPIGNLDDITIRAIKTLFTVDFVACEDTRVTGQLLSILKQRLENQDVSIKGLSTAKKPALISYYDEIEEQKTPEIIGYLESGHDCALVCDAGTPLISDPGFKLVNRAIKQGVRIVPIPGPSSVLTALVTSGLPTHDYRFIGYLPSKRTKRITVLNSILTSLRPYGQKYTIIMFEAPQRVKETLNDIKEVFGDVEVVLARELTKVHEEFIRGKISNLIDKKFEEKGEFVILFSTNIPQE